MTDSMQNTKAQLLSPKEGLVDTVDVYVDEVTTTRVRMVVRDTGDDEGADRRALAGEAIYRTVIGAPTTTRTKAEL